MNRIKLLVSILLLLSAISFAQTTVTVGSITSAVPGTVVTVPVNITNFNNIGAISLAIQFDRSVLTPYPSDKGLGSNINSAASGAIINVIGNKVTFGWYSANPLNISSGKLCDLSFTYLGGTSNLKILTSECEISYPNLTDLTGVVYTNGVISNGNAPALPTVPVLVSPNNGSTGISQNPSLTWNAVSEASSYSVIVSANSDFSSPVVNVSNLNTNIYSLSGLAKNTTYYWKVSAENSSGTSGYSAVWHFTTLSDVQIPSAPNIVSPSSGSTGIQANPTLIWSSATGATGYNLQVSTSADFTTLTANYSGLTSTSLSLSSLQPETKYYWRVSASNSAGTSPYSTANFTTVSSASQITVSAGSVISAKAGDIITIPINVTNFTNIGSISIELQFDRSVLTPYPSDSQLGTNINGLTSGAIVNANGNKVTFGWYSTNGISIASGKLCDMKFVYNGGTSSINFLSSQCEIAHTDLSVVSGISYNNGLVTGSVTPTIPDVPVLSLPANYSTGVSVAPSLSWNASSGANTYSIQVATDVNFTSVIYSASSLSSTQVSVTGLNANSQYFWRVNATNNVGTSAYSVIWSFTTSTQSGISAPALISPVNGISGVSLAPTLTWNTSVGATSYDLQVSTDSQFKTIFYYQPGITTTSFTIYDLALNTVYYWRVSATNGATSSGFSAPFSFSTGVTYPMPPTLVYPAENAVSIPINAALSWNSSANATSYNLKVATDAAFTSMTADRNGLTDTTFTVNGLKNYTTYYWKVSATNSNGTSDYSSVRSFRTVLTAPDAPVLTAPSDGYASVPLNSSLMWNASARASDYNVQIATDAAFTSIALSKTGITDTYLNVSTLLGNTKYYWRVSASNEGGTSPYSPVFSFTTQAIYSISGKVTYYNTIKSPLKNVQLKLYILPGNDSLTTTTDNDGNYSFGNLQAGSYIIKATKTDGWGGSNSADAFTIGRYYSQIDTLDLLQLCAGDVNMSYSVNANDALLIMQRYINAIASFARPDWVFKPYNVASIKNVILNASNGGADTLKVQNSNLFVDIAALCTGDVNRSYLPGVTTIDKSNSIGIKNIGVTKVTAKTNFEIPVCLDRASEISSLSLKLSYPKESAEFKGIKFNPLLSGAVFKEENGTVYISWANMTQSKVELSDNSNLFAVQLAPKSTSLLKSNINLSVIGDNSITGLNGDEINTGLVAATAQIELPSNYSLEQNYPNPFNPSTTIKFSVPYKSQVSLKVYNTLGMVVKELYNGIKEEGSYDIQFNANSLSSGVYFYSVTAKSLENGKDFNSVKKMMLLK